MKLVPLGPQHLPEMEALVGDPDVRRFTLIPDPPPAGYATTWIERYADPDVRLGWMAYEDDAPVGVALIPSIDREGLQAELGYMTLPAARGRGAAVRMVEEMTRIGFTDLGMARLYLRIDVLNTPSQQVAARAGYTLEGTLRSAPFKQGLRCDLQVWSRLPSD
jgi:RimJ/RimL family protein N-acetyltransferase